MNQILLLAGGVILGHVLAAAAHRFGRRYRELVARYWRQHVAVEGHLSTLEDIFGQMDRGGMSAHEAIKHVRDAHRKLEISRQRKK